MVNQHARAYRAWEILTSQAAKKNTITYETLASRLGIHHRAVRFVLDLIQSYCLEQKLSPLTILVISKSTGLPGKGFIAWDANSIPEGQEQVFGSDWDRIQNPFEFSADNTGYDSLVQSLVSRPENSEDIYTKVKVRGMAQRVFRDALVKAYGGKCAFTGISFCSALDSAHIIPWSKCEPRYKMDPRNGILLSSFHHKLFDQGLITITEEYKIVYYDPDMNKHICSDFDKLLTVDLHMKSMKLPSNRDLLPHLDLIKQHNEELEWI